MRVLIECGAIDPAFLAHDAAETAAGLRAPQGAGLLPPEEALLW